MMRRSRRPKTTLVDIAKERADAHPNRTVYTFLGRDLDVVRQWTYSEVTETARTVAAVLQQYGAAGDRALLLYPAGVDFIGAFFGCLFAGVIPVPLKAPAPARIDRAAERLRTVLADCEARFVLTTGDLVKAAARAEAEPFQRGPRWIATDEIPLATADLWKDPGPGPDDVALLQYTSGSTSRPRGVVVTHANLLSNQELIRRAFRQDRDSHIVSWLPHHHDMGLIGGILQPLYAGATCSLMSPVSFLQRPLRWLQAISELDGTTSGGPDFAYDLCVDRIDEAQRAELDLSSWKVAFNGAEPIRAETLERFAAAFAPCGFDPGAFHPCYGLAEATLLVSGARSGPEPVRRRVDERALRRHRVRPAGEGKHLVASGRVPDAVDVAIVDPESGTRCSDDRIGEIWVRGDSVASGYWGRPEESAATFGAAYEGQSPYLRTGDLGFLADGALFVTGRLKDLVILRGSNHYPHDLERTAQRSHEHLRSGAGAVFTAERDGREAAVLVQELAPRHPPAEELDGVIEAIRDAVVAEHEVRLAEILLVKAGRVPMTTSGKVRRRATAEMYRTGRFEPLRRWPEVEGRPAACSATPSGTATAAEAAEDVGAIRSWLLREFVERSESVATVDGSRPVRLLGLDSLAAAEITYGLEASFGRNVPLGLLFEDLSVDELAAEVASLPPVEEAVEDEPGGSSPKAGLVSPLSENQKALWFLQEMDPTSTAYNLCFGCRLLEPVDADGLRAAITAVAARHPILRVQLQSVEPGTEPRQVVVPGVELPFREVDAAALSSAELREALRWEAATPFDLRREPPLRVRLLRRNDHDILALVVHHLVTDLASMELLAEEIAAAYSAARAGDAPSAEPETLAYGRFVRWQEEMLRSPRGEELRSYWAERFADGVPAADLPYDRRRVRSGHSPGDRVDLDLGPDLVAGLRHLARDQGVTLNSVLLAAFFALLGRTSGRRELVLGSPTSGRSRAEFRDLFGYFVNMVPLRVDLGEEPRFLDLVQRVQAAVAGALMHADYPLSRLVRDLHPERGPSQTGLFDAVFALQNGRRLGGDALAPFLFRRESAPLAIGDLRLQSMEIPELPAQFDLSLLLVEDGDAIRGGAQYAADLFDTTTVARLLGHYRAVLEQVAEAPGRAVEALRLLDRSERHQVLIEWVDPARGERFEPVTAQVAGQVELHGDRPAVTAGDRWVSYRELASLSRRVAAELRALGVKTEERIALVLPAGVEQVVCALGTLRAGAAYVSLDASLPGQRLRWMIEDAGCRLVLSVSELSPEALLATSVPVVAVDRAGWTEETTSDTAPTLEAAPTAEQSAYVIYTSGSTGRPKGVVVTHGGLSNLVAWHRRVYGVGPEDRATLLAGLGFDASVWELWPYLASGASLRVVPEEARVSPAALRDLLDGEGVTLSFVPTVLAESLIRMQWPESVSLRALLTGGEKLAGRARDDLPFALVNHYGPTENTVVATAEPVPPGTAAPPIGRPIASVRGHALDAALEPVPMGIAGEFCLGGASLARGYIGRPGETASLFVPDPFADEPGARLYRTGDLVRHLADGRLQFLGRIDQQVKIRGQRIELGEIESVLARQPGIDEAVVAIRGDSRLVGYVVASQNLDEERLRSALRATLPEPMVPSRFVVLDGLPLTPNGKVDRRGLPEPQWTDEAAHRLPATPTEELLADVWSEVFGIGRIGRRDDFFELGGHSLLATRVVSRIREIFSVDLPLRALFEASVLSELAARIDAARRGGDVRIEPIDREALGGLLPLSYAQERLWFLDRLEPESAAYNIPAALRLSGPVDEAALEGAFREVLRRHEVLRSHVTEVAGRPKLAVEDWPEWGWEVVDLRELTEEEREAEAAELARAEAVTPFDLAKGPLVRVRFVRLTAEESLLLVTQHHAVSDGWSMGILMSEVSRLYEALRRGEDSPLPELPIQYPDFAIWQRRWLEEGAEAEQLAYWRDRLEDVAGLLELPLDRPRPAVQRFEGASRELVLDAELTERLEALGQRQSVTLYMLLLAGFALLLYRVTRREDLVVGSPIAGRNVRQAEELIGLFVNTLALRTRVRPEEPFAALLEQVQETTLGAYAHQDVPFERLVEEVAPGRSLSHAPLVQVTFAIEDDAEVGLRNAGFGDLDLRLEEIDVARVKFDQSWTVVRTGSDENGGDGLRVRVGYRRDLFDATTIERMLRGYRRILEQVAAAPERSVESVRLLDRAARHQVLVEWGAPERGEDFEPVTAQIARQVRDHGEYPAVVAGDRWVSYRELDRLSRRVVAELLARGIGEGGTEARVALVLPPGIEQVASALGVLRAGAVYVSLDPSLPGERLRWMIEDAGCRLVLSVAELAPEEFLETSVPVVAVDRAGWMEETNPDPIPEPAAITPERSAYLIYTSGSTGRPKGVVLNHGGLSNLVAWHRRVYRLGPKDRGTLLAGLGFDASVWELWPYLSSGAALHVMPEEARVAPDALRERLETEAITLSFVPTVLAESLMRMEWSGSTPLRALLTGGEKLTGRAREDLHFALVNHYGPTENTVVATAERVAPGTAAPPIGRPIAGVRGHVLDSSLEPVPVGVVGELCLGGAGLARGYTGRPGETASVFVPNPFAPEPGEEGARLYRTGDLVRHLADGRIEFEGRIDQQVKLRGYRIELGEIESVLVEQPGIDEAVAAVRDGDRLVGYVVARSSEGEGLDEEGLRAALRATLPEYMVPSRLVAVDELPLTSSGKVDRRALAELAPEPERSGTGESAPPATPTEELLAGIWSEVLGVEAVGRRDDFFDLGGHSLLATQVVSRIREVFSVELPLRALFESSGLAGLAGRIDTTHRSSPRPPIRRRGDRTAPLSFSQERLWFLEHLQPGCPVYHMPGSVRLTGDLDERALTRSLDDLVERHEILRTTFRADASGQPVQKIAEPRPLRLVSVDLSDLDERARNDRLRRRILQEVERPFDLGRGPLLRTLLFRMGDDEHLLLFVMHHIVSDGWSVAVLTREVARFYQARVRGETAELSPLPIQYSDFARWQREWLQGEVLEEQLAYWREHLAEPLPVVQLRTDKPRPTVQSFAGSRVPIRVERPLAERLHALGRREEVTLFMVLSAAFQTLLHRATGQEDVIVGSLIANRNRVEVEGLIGFFVNALALRTDLSGSPTFRELLARVRGVTLAAYAHQDLPFEKLVEAVQPERDLGRSPLYQVMLVLQNAPVEDIRLPGLRVESRRVETDTSALDLTVTLAEDDEGIAGTLEFNTDLFDRSTIERLRRHLLALLEAAAAAPDERVARLPMLTEGEREQIVTDWNRTAADHPLERCFHELFAEQAVLAPARTAASDGEEELTYRELAGRANRVARRLLDDGTESEEVVAVLAPRGLDLLVAFLGILESGAAYLPLDPLHPPARIRQVLRESGARRVLRSAGHGELLESALDGMEASERPEVSEIGELVVGESSETVAGRKVDPTGLAYVLFTSGSTGRPKGAMVHHRGMLNHLFAKVSDLDLSERDVVAQTASQCFDISIWQMLSPLLLGGRVHVFDEEAARDPARMLGTAASEGVTILEVVPSLLRELIEEIHLNRDSADLSALRWMIATGEALPPELVRGWLRLHPGVPVMNAYGPTECSDDVTHHVVTVTPPEGQTRVPIGRALDNTRLYILDPGLNPVPAGITGELHVGGAGVGRGYLASPARTAPVFIPDPFADEPGERLYRTGDLARHLPDGTIEFLSRIDHQVKIRGFRIELGEIESVLQSHPSVRQAVLASVKSPAGQDQLVAYFVPASRENSDAPDAEALSQDQVEYWQMIFGGIYRSSGEDDPTLDLSGWTSSYTGVPLPREEMAEWVESTVGNVLAHEPERVLELGCGTGMLLLRIAPSCREYWGTDLTKESIETLGAYLEGKPEYDHVRLFHRPADDFQGIPDEFFDAVVLNSVVQYFPSIDYLVTVLRGALRVVRDGGFVYLGDIRSLPLLPALHFSLADFGADDSQGPEQLRRAMQAGLENEQELVVHPDFFRAVERRLPRVVGIDLELKRGRSANELTKFRYDVVIRVGDGAPDGLEVSDRPGWQGWDGGFADLASVERHLRGERPATLAIRGVPNARLEREALGMAWLDGELPAETRGELAEVRGARGDRHGGGIDPEDWRRLAERLGYTLGVHPSEDGDVFGYDVILADARNGCFRPPCPRRADGFEPAPWRTYANNPLHQSSASRTVAALREHLRETLPDYMVPSIFVPMQAMPLTANGKVDRRALPEPERDRSGSDLPFVPPQSATEETIADVWSEVLGIDEVGTQDRFFDIGGDSLKLVKVYRRLDDLYPGVLSVVDLFQHNTVIELGRHIDGLAGTEDAPADALEVFEV